MFTVGIDLLRFARLSLSLEDPSFIEKVFSSHERENEKKGPPQEKVIYYSKLFSCKEAVFKALEIEANNLKNWQEIEVSLQEGRAPQVKLDSKFLNRLGYTAVQLQVSLSYEVDLVCAVALVSKEGAV